MLKSGKKVFLRSWKLQFSLSHTWLTYDRMTSYT